MSAFFYLFTLRNRTLRRGNCNEWFVTRAKESVFLHYRYSLQLIVLRERKKQKKILSFVSRDERKCERRTRWKRATRYLQEYSYSARRRIYLTIFLSFNAYPPSALRISISPSLPGAFAGIRRVLKEQDIPGQFFPFLFTERENVLRWEKSDEKLCTERGT